MSGTSGRGLEGVARLRNSPWAAGLAPKRLVRQFVCTQIVSSARKLVKVSQARADAEKLSTGAIARAAPNSDRSAALRPAS